MPCALAGPLCSLYHSLLRDQGQDTNENELSPVTANAEEEKLVFLFARGGGAAAVQPSQILCRNGSGLRLRQTVRAEEHCQRYS